MIEYSPDGEAGQGLPPGQRHRSQDRVSSRKAIKLTQHPAMRGKTTMRANLTDLRKQFIKAFESLAYHGL